MRIRLRGMIVASKGVGQKCPGRGGGSFQFFGSGGGTRRGTQHSPTPFEPLSGVGGYMYIYTTNCKKQVVLANCKKLPKWKCDKLDEVDRLARRDAQRKGKSHPVAVGPAITVAGRVVGRIDT